jgi:hypothetical protein
VRFVLLDCWMMLNGWIGQPVKHFLDRIFWKNYGDLTVTSLEWWLVGVITQNSPISGWWHWWSTRGTVKYYNSAKIYVEFYLVAHPT